MLKSNTSSLLEHGSKRKLNRKSWLKAAVNLKFWGKVLKFRPFVKNLWKTSASWQQFYHNEAGTLQAIMQSLVMINEISPRVGLNARHKSLNYFFICIIWLHPAHESTTLMSCSNIFIWGCSHVSREYILTYCSLTRQFCTYVRTVPRVTKKIEKMHVYVVTISLEHLTPML